MHDGIWAVVREMLIRPNKLICLPKMLLVLTKSSANFVCNPGAGGSSEGRFFTASAEREMVVVVVEYTTSGGCPMPLPFNATIRRFGLSLYEMISFCP